MVWGVPIPARIAEKQECQEHVARNSVCGRHGHRARYGYAERSWSVPSVARRLLCSGSFVRRSGPRLRWLRNDHLLQDEEGQASQGPQELLCSGTDLLCSGSCPDLLCPGPGSDLCRSGPDLLCSGRSFLRCPGCSDLCRSGCCSSRCPGCRSGRSSGSADRRRSPEAAAVISSPGQPPDSKLQPPTFTPGELWILAGSQRWLSITADLISPDSHSRAGVFCCALSK